MIDTEQILWYKSYWLSLPLLFEKYANKAPIEWDVVPPSLGPNINFIAYDELPVPISHKAVPRNIVCPESVQETGIKGTVIVQLFVDKYGLNQLSSKSHTNA